MAGHFLIIRFLDSWSMFRHVQQDSASPPDVDQNTFLSKSIIFIHTLGPKQGSNFMVLHNPYFHGLGLGCSPYAQPLKQGQENYQRYTLKDNLGQPSDP